MDNDSKSIFASVTFWGVVAGVVSQAATHYGYQIDASGLANDLVGLAGALVALWGRLRASQPVHVIPK